MGLNDILIEYDLKMKFIDEYGIMIKKRIYNSLYIEKL